jgi:hypothetical protein
VDGVEGDADEQINKCNVMGVYLQQQQQQQQQRRTQWRIANWCWVELVLLEWCGVVWCGMLTW